MTWQSSDAIPSYIFKGDDLPALQARDRLRERFSANFDLLLPEEGPIRVDGAEHLGLMLGGMVLLLRKMYVHDIARSPGLIRSSQLDHYILTVPLEQRGPTYHILGDGRALEQHVGESLLLDMAQPMRAHIESGTDLTLFIARDALDELLPRHLDLHGVKLTGAVATLLADQLRTVAREGTGLRSPEAQLLARGTLHLVAASLAPKSDSLALARPQIEHLLARRIGSYIDSHLADPDLSVEQLCGAFGLSRSSLYRLFERVGGVAAFIRVRRLAKAHVLLAGAEERIHLKRLADDFGFRSAAQFRRAFREQFGYSPSEAKSQISPLAQRAHTLLPEAQRFAGWLRALHR